MLIDGKLLAQQIRDSLQLKVQDLESSGVHPSFAVILVGHDAGSEAYVRQKKKAAESIGIIFNSYLFEDNVAEITLTETIEWLNKDKNINGLIVQLPLPPHLDSKKFGNMVNPAKDIDGLHSQTQFNPPIAEAVLEILKSISVSPQGKKVVVMGRGDTAGKPIANMMLQKGAKITIVHSKTKNVSFFTKQADIIISCVGRKNVVTPDMVHKDTILIGVGIHREEDGRLYGDYDEEKIAKIVAYYTPTPGGMGPVNVACLLKNVVQAAQ